MRCDLGSSLKEFAKTWLNEDLKELFPHDAVTEEMVNNRKSSFGILTDKDFDVKSVDSETSIKFNNKPFWPLAEKYCYDDVSILFKGTFKVEELYNKIGYSISDKELNGLSSIGLISFIVL